MFIPGRANRIDAATTSPLTGYVRADGSGVEARALSGAVVAQPPGGDETVETVFPSGAADERSRIQAAIDAVAAAGGGVVKLAAGDYPVGESSLGSGYCLHLPGRVWLVGCGAATRLQNTHATADTVRVRASPITLAGYCHHWGLRGLHFNPAAGVTRTDDAAEIAVGMTRQGFIDGVSFGRREALAGLSETPSAGEESRVGTCMALGGASAPDQSENAMVRHCRAHGFYRFVKAANFVGLVVSDSFTDANSVTAQPVHLSGKVEGLKFTNIDFVNTKNVDGNEGSFPTTAVVLKIEGTGVRFNTFTNVFFDTQYMGVHATGGTANSFVNCWYSNRPGYAVVLEGTASDYTLMGSMFGNNGAGGVWLKSGGRHVVSGNRFFGNGVRVTADVGHVRVGTGVTGVRVLGNTFATSAAGLTGGALPAVLIDAGVAGVVRVQGNDLGGLAVTDNSGGGAVVADND